MLDQLVASQSACVASVTLSSKATGVGQFMRLSPPTFTDVKVGKNLQGFVDEMEKIFRVMHATNMEGVEFASY